MKGESIKDAIAGVVIGVVSDITGNNSLRDEYVPESSENYNSGLQAADAGMVAAGAVAVASGGSEVIQGAVGGALAIATSGGTATPAVVAVEAQAAGKVAGGLWVMNNARSNLKGDYNYGAKQDNKGKKNDSKRAARKAGEEKRNNQKASEGYAKYKANNLEKAQGKDARRDAHDAKDKIGRDRTKKELDEDYKTRK